jgi:hypothetical protein
MENDSNWIVIFYPIIRVILQQNCNFKSWKLKWIFFARVLLNVEFLNGIFCRGFWS